LSPYDFFQYWVNADDRDVERFLGYFTFLPLDEVRRTRELEGADLNLAKTVLAFEATRITHGAAAAREALEAAASVFGRRAVPPDLFPSSTIPRADDEAEADVPMTTVDRAAFAAGMTVVSLLVTAGLAPSRSEARRLIQQGGAYLNNERITDVDAMVSLDAVGDEGLLLRKGKKQYRRVVVI
jgi:tyrosyl-tRNA synthetase